jgi:hypothetical protein
MQQPQDLFAGTISPESQPFIRPNSFLSMPEFWPVRMKISHMFGKQRQETVTSQATCRTQAS